MLGKSGVFKLFCIVIYNSEIMDTVERRMQFDNIITAHQLGIISFHEAHQRMMDLFTTKSYISIKSINPN